MSYCKDMVRTLGSAWRWVAAQFWAILLLILVALAWTRLPDKYWWQVALTLLILLVIIAAFLVLQAGTMRRLLGAQEDRARFWTGALMLLAWIAVVWAVWALLDFCDDQIELWAGYLNSKMGADARSTVFTYEHISSWLTGVEWVLRWIVTPAVVIPLAMASAQRGWRLRWRKALRVIVNWRWWPAVIASALVGVLLIGHFFTAEPHGSVARQIWVVALKLAAAYVLAVAIWVKLLAWCAVLLKRDGHRAEPASEEALRVTPIAPKPPVNDQATHLPLPDTGEGASGNA